MPYSYTDLYGKLTFNANSGSKASIFGFNFQDHVNYQDVSDLQWSSEGLGSDFILIPENSPVLIEGNIAPGVLTILSPFLCCGLAEKIY